MNSSGEKIYISNNSVGVVKNNHLHHVWGMQNDVTEKKKVEDVLRQIAEGIHTTMDESFFKSMVKFLDKNHHVDYACIAKLDENNEFATSLACLEDDKIVADFDFEINNSPCKFVLENGEADYFENVSILFPKSEFFQKKNYECYMGRVLKDSKNNNLGVGLVHLSTSFPGTARWAARSALPP